MILSDLIFTLIEDLILSSVIALILDVRRYILYIILTTVMVFLETYVLTYIVINNFLLIIFMILTHFFMLILFHRRSLTRNIIVILFSLFSLLFSDYFSLYLFSVLENIPIILLSSCQEIFFDAILFSRFIFAIISIMAYSFYKRKLTNHITIEKNGIIIAIVLIIVFIFTILGESLVYVKVSNITILLIMFFLMVLFILFCVLFYRIQLENKEKIELIKNKTKMEYFKENYIQMNKMYDVIVAKEHNMIYLLKKIRYYVSNKEILSLIDKEIDKIISYKFISNTSNYKFDIDVSNKINILKNQGYDIKVIMMIEEDPIFENDNIINEILAFIDNVSKCSKNKKIELRIKKVSNKIVLKGITKCIDENIDDTTININRKGEYVLMNKLIHMESNDTKNNTKI